MNFTKVPRQIQIQIQKLTEDEVFQERFATDEVLDQLDALKYDPFLQANQLQLIRDRKLVINGVELENITLMLWSFLYTIKSPLIFDEDNCSKIDVDLFFYLLQTKDYSNNMDQLLVKSISYTDKVMKLEWKQVVNIIQKIVKIHFRALNMFPKIKAEGRKPAFNVDWLTSIATKVCQVSNYKIQQVYNQLSICQAYYLFAQYCRQKGSQSIYLRTEQEIMEEQDQRATVLVVERLIELKVIEEKDKIYYINMIHIGDKDNG